MRAFRIVTILMGLLFLLAVAVQFNDPDPLQWMAIYGAAAVACALAVRGRLPGWLPVLVGAIAIAWAGTLLPNVWGRVRFTDLFREIGMDSASIEEGRETVGLLIVAAYMFVVYFASSSRPGLQTRRRIPRR
jgi:hypothetical protein